MTDHTPRPLSDADLDRVLADAAQHWRVAPPPDGALFDDIAAEAFDVPIPAARASRSPSWRIVGLAAAACLVIGVALGRVSRPSGPTLAQAPASAPSVATPAAADPAQRLTEDLLGRTALLLASLPANPTAGSRDARLADNAARLLATTRVLLDAPTAQDRRLRALLEDLELVLVQVARLRTPREGSDLSIIRAAVAERDLVPRLRSAVADLSGGSE